MAHASAAKKTDVEKQVDTVTRRLTPNAIPKRVQAAIERRIELKAQRDEAQKKIDEIDEELIADVEDLGGTIETKEWKVSKIASSNRHINKDKLIAAGVKPTIIAKCTDEKDYTYLKVTVKK